MDEERLILARAEDLIRRSSDRNIPLHTGFLDAQQQGLLRRSFGTVNGDPTLVYCGGYEDADRVVLAVLPDYITDPDSYLSEVLAVLRVSVSKGSAASKSGRPLTHGDYLGALLGLGIERSVCGDILVREDGADLIVLADMADFLLQNFTTAGRAHLSLARVPLSDLIVPELSCREIHDTVASLRLDAVLASAFRISRGKAAEYIRQGLVFVDHLEAGKTDQPVAEGAELVIRHHGKARLLEAGSRSRKGRINVTIARYQAPR